MISEAQKKLMLGAIGVFATVSLLIISVNSLSHGWHLGYSISRYVGLETWSAVLFLLGNIAVSGLFGKYLYVVNKSWQMSKWFYGLVLIMVVAFLGLSFCPMGYFDSAGVEFGASVPSQIHKVCSRLMFACMLIMALVWQWSGVVQMKMRRWCAVFVAYGIFCLMGYCLGSGWFFPGMLVFESCYILGFMILCWRLQGVNKGKERTNDGRTKARN